MTLKTKLGSGLGIIAVVIAGLIIYLVLENQAEMKANDRIVKDNYSSIVYCKNMFLALAQQAEQAGTLRSSYRESLIAAYLNVTQSISAVYDVNMTAAEQGTRERHQSDVRDAVVGIIVGCIILACCGFLYAYVNRDSASRGRRASRGP